MHAIFLPTPDRSEVTWDGSTAHTVIDALTFLARRETVEVTNNGKTRGAAVASVERASDGLLDVTFGTWRTNSFNTALLAFDVAHTQPKNRFKTANGAARAIAGWLNRE